MGGAHALATGTVAALLVFGPFLLLALIGMPVLDARARRRLGVETGMRWAEHTGRLAGWARGLAEAGPWRVAGGLGLYVLLLGLHRCLVGFDPLPLW